MQSTSRPPPSLLHNVNNMRTEDRNEQMTTGEADDNEVVIDGSEMKSWWDYRRFSMHPRSLSIINEYQHEK